MFTQVISHTEKHMHLKHTHTHTYIYAHTHICTHTHTHTLSLSLNFSYSGGGVVCNWTTVGIKMPAMQWYKGVNTYKKCVTTAHDTEPQPSPPFLNLNVAFLARDNGAGQWVSGWHFFCWICWGLICTLRNSIINLSKSSSITLQQPRSTMKAAKRNSSKQNSVFSFCLQLVVLRLLWA